MNSQQLVIMSIFHFLKANISVFQYGLQKSWSRSAWINLKHFSILEICSLRNVQYFSISLAEKDVAVNFEEQLELTVILGLPAHFIGPRCITKEFRDTVFKYLRFVVLQHSIVVSNIQHTVFACMYVTYVCMYMRLDYWPALVCRGVSCTTTTTSTTAGCWQA